MLAGNADFGVGTSALVLARHAGKPVVALAAIFQHSPYVIIAREEDATQGTHDLVGKRVMLEPQSDELLAYLKREGIAPEKLTRVEHSFDPQDLIDGKVDAITAYVTNQPWYLDRAKFEYHVYTPRSAGIDFYGDNLFTSEQQLHSHPERVKAFRAASLRGWQYAMAHPEEIADLIIASYSKQHSRDYLLFQAAQMQALLSPEMVEIGYMYAGRWRHIADTYAEIGLLPRNFSLEGFLYDPDPKPDLTWLYRGLVIALALLAVISALALFVRHENRRLAQYLSVRSEAVEALQAQIRITETILDNADELRRWQSVMLTREDRVQELKRELNELCRSIGEPVRYASVESQPGNGIPG